MKINKKWEVPEIKENYALENFRPLTIKERAEIYSKLTKKQRKLIDEHRKYLIRSEFLKDSYLKASDWEFVDLKIDDKYPDVHKTNDMLYCECGRHLKYQYIVKSKETQKHMSLGIQHFKDHLKIPQQVATEITQRLNNVDIALDELLWLKRLGIEFPQELWENYAFFIYSKQFRNTETQINYALTRRIADFKEAEMPIYLSDYQAILTEIKKNHKEKINIVDPYYTQENFNVFLDLLPTVINQEALFNQATVWSNAIQKRLKTHPEKPHLPRKYFEDLYTILKLNPSQREKEMALFGNKGMGKWIQREVYDHLLSIVELYGLGEVFLSQIHPFMREGLVTFIEQNETEKEEKIKNTYQEITGILESVDEEVRRELIKRMKEELLQ